MYLKKIFRINFLKEVFLENFLEKKSYRMFLDKCSHRKFIEEIIEYLMKKLTHRNFSNRFSNGTL